MKKNILNLFLTAILMIMLSLATQGQNPPPPPGDPGGGGGNPPVGGGAPIGSGLVTLIAFGAFYGAGKVYQLKKSRSGN